MVTIAESVINFFAPAFHSWCQSVWGKDLTQLWAEQTGLPWTRIHEHVIFWLSVILLLSIILNIILSLGLRKLRGDA